MAANEGMNLNDINFGIKIEKIYEKVKQAIDKGETNKIVGYMFDFKSEVEQYTGNTGVGVLGSDALDRWDAYNKDQRKK